MHRLLHTQGSFGRTPLLPADWDDLRHGFVEITLDAPWKSRGPQKQPKTISMTVTSVAWLFHGCSMVVPLFCIASAWIRHCREWQHTSLRVWRAFHPEGDLEMWNDMDLTPSNTQLDPMGPSEWGHFYQQSPCDQHARWFIAIWALIAMGTFFRCKIGVPLGKSPKACVDSSCVKACYIMKLITQTIPNMQGTPTVPTHTIIFEKLYIYRYIVCQYVPGTLSKLLLPFVQGYPNSFSIQKAVLCKARSCNIK